MLPFVIISVFGILFGAFGFCLGLALLVNENKRVDQIIKMECLLTEDDFDETRELTEEDFARQKRLAEVTKRSPLSFMFVLEGALLFLASVLLLILKVAIQSMTFPWYGMLVIVLGVPILSFLINGFVMMNYTPFEAPELDEQVDENPKEEQEELQEQDLGDFIDQVTDNEEYLDESNGSEDVENA